MRGAEAAVKGEDLDIVRREGGGIVAAATIPSTSPRLFYPMLAHCYLPDASCMRCGRDAESGNFVYGEVPRPRLRKLKGRWHMIGQRHGDLIRGPLSVVSGTPGNALGLVALLLEHRTAALNGRDRIMSCIVSRGIDPCPYTPPLRRSSTYSAVLTDSRGLQ